MPKYTLKTDKPEPTVQIELIQHGPDVNITANGIVVAFFMKDGILALADTLGFATDVKAMGLKLDEDGYLITIRE